jgi:hypothetical protein
MDDWKQSQKYLVSFFFSWRGTSPWLPSSSSSLSLTNNFPGRRELALTIFLLLVHSSNGSDANVCYVCGSETKGITWQDKTVDITGKIVTCEELELMGLNGEIPSEQCPFVPIFASLRCGCDDIVSDATPSPSTNSGLICYICGEGKKVGYPEFVLELPGDKLTCGQLEDRGLSGVLTEEECILLPQAIDDPCDCRSNNETKPTSPTCEGNDCNGTFIETNSPTSIPSHSPSIIISKSSSPMGITGLSACHASTGGVFGDTIGAEALVEYLYEAITTPETVPSALANILSSTIEPAVTSYLVTDLFSFVCNRHLAQSRRLAIIGLSPVPDDELLTKGRQLQSRVVYRHGHSLSLRPKSNVHQN